MHCIPEGQCEETVVVAMMDCPQQPLGRDAAKPVPAPSSPRNTGANDAPHTRPPTAQTYDNETHSISWEIKMTTSMGRKQSVTKTKNLFINSFTRLPPYVEVDAHETEGVQGGRGGKEMGQQTVAHV